LEKGLDSLRKTGSREPKQTVGSNGSRIKVWSPFEEKVGQNPKFAIQVKIAIPL